MRDAPLPAIAEPAQVAVFTIDQQGRVVDCTHGAERMFRYDRAAISGADLTDLLISPPLRERLRQVTARHEAPGTGPELEAPLQTVALRGDGTEFPIELVICRVPIDEPKLFTVWIRDLTARRRAEQNQLQDGERFRRILKTTHEGIWQVDAEGTTTFVNQRMADLLGYTMDEMIGASMFSFMDDEARAAVQASQAGPAVAAGAGQNVVNRFDFEYVRKDGSRIWTFVSVACVLDAAGDFAGSLALVTDISARKRAEDALRESEERLRTVVANAPIVLWAVDANGTYTLFDGPALRHGRYEPGALVGTSIWDILRQYPESAEDVRRAFAGENVVTETQARGRTFETRYTLQRDEQGRVSGLIGLGIDVTERKQAQSEAEEARRLAEELAAFRERRAAEAQALAEVGIILSSVLEPTELYQRFLEQVARIIPCDYASVLLYEDNWVVVGASWGEPSLTPGTRLFPLWDEQGKWVPISRETPVYLPDTAENPAWISLPLRYGDATPRSIIRVPLIINGEPVGAFSVSSHTPYYYSNHQVQLATALGPYVTQALHNARLFAAERDRARAAVELANIQNDFVAGTSHELRTPLTAILGFTQLLETYWTDLDEAQRLAGVKRIALAANRQLRLVEDLLLLTTLDNRSLVSESHAVAIAPLARQAVAEVQASYDDQPIALIGAADVMVQADPSRVLQILCNLLDNASKYSPEGSGVHVSWREEGESVVLRVRDHGPGIPDEGRQYLFTRFGRVPGSLMRAGRIGTGLGLYLGRELAEAMGGRLDLESTSADGTVFRLELPYADAAGVQ